MNTWGDWDCFSLEHHYHYLFLALATSHLYRFLFISFYSYRYFLPLQCLYDNVICPVPAGKRSPNTATVAHHGATHGATHGAGCGFGRPSSTPAVRRASTPRTTRSMEKQPLQYWNQQARQLGSLYSGIG
jgi:hypothetical protein